MDGELTQTASAFWTLFNGRRDCFGRGKGLCVKKPVTEELVARHLGGELAIGVYPLTPDGRCHWTCTDLDAPEEAEATRWARAVTLYEALRRLGAEPFIERSKSKGHHLWVFFREPVEAAWARRLMRRALADAALPADTEVFPKHDRLSAEVPFSGYVNLPYFGGQNGDGRRMMLSPASGQPWRVDEFLDALTLTDANDVLLGPEPDTAQAGDVVIEAGEPEAAPLLGEDAPYGQRHAHAKKVVGLLVRRLWPDGEQAALDAAVCWNAARCKPPLPEGEVRDMVHDFWRKEEKRQRQEVKPTKDTEPPALLSLPLGAFLEAGTGRRPDIVAPIARSGITIVAGGPGQGKTLLGLEAAVTKATGVSRLGFVAEPGVVLFVGADMGAEDTRDYLNMLMYPGRELALENLHIAIAPGLLLDEPKGQAALRELLRGLRAEFLVLDYFGMFIGSDGFTNRELRPALDTIRAIRDIDGVAVMWLDQTRKQATGRFTSQAPALDELYGGRAKSAICDLAYFIKQDAGSHVFTVKGAKERGAGFADISLVFDAEGGWALADTVPVHLTAAEASVAAAIAAAPNLEGCTKAEIVAVTGLGGRTVESALSRLLYYRQITYGEPRGRAFRYKSATPQKAANNSAIAPCANTATPQAPYKGAADMRSTAAMGAANE